MEIVSIQKYIHSSPRKLRLVADMVKKMEPGKAVEVLAYTPKMAALDLSSAIKTAMANAKQKSLANINFKSIEINEGPRLKRMRSAARGRGRPYKKRMSHIKIVLSDQLIVKSKKEKK